MVDFIKHFIEDETGATAIEYGLIAALVSIAAVVAFGATGDTILTAFTNIAEGFCTATGGNFSMTANGVGSCT
ncbi:Flp family type IVb pilin [Sneathiella chungangensis]|uniref:Flp family type IVb pilin n=1 Tax=Sneathiella chungangensis TaxID=1418234 RepID=A0A845ME68_9PROT|nr:Flp family type IVb pilin [Sneathiella chungangensis]MZR22353.1 Flp family type IVb pilin [Sneathiella chungangensis]